MLKREGFRVIDPSSEIFGHSVVRRGEISSTSEMFEFSSMKCGFVIGYIKVNRLLNIT